MSDDYAPEPPIAAATAALDVWRSRLARVRARVNEAELTAGRALGDVVLLPTVKYLEPADTALLVEAGATDLAENRLDALVAKQAALAPRQPTWHFIGRVQSRQVVEIARRLGAIGMIHSLASERAIDRLAAAGERGGVHLPQLLVQVNVADDPAKDGIAMDAVDRFLERLPESIRIAGFMTMPAFTEDPEQSRQAFHDLRELRDRCAVTFAERHDLHVLSMGTSQDLEVAIAEGATHVRLGRILFGDGE